MSVQIVKNTEPEATEWWSGMFVGGWGSVYNSRVSTLYTGHCTLHTVHWNLNTGQHTEHHTLNLLILGGWHLSRVSTLLRPLKGCEWEHLTLRSANTHNFPTQRKLFRVHCKLPFKLSHPLTRFVSTVAK